MSVMADEITLILADDIVDQIKEFRKCKSPVKFFGVDMKNPPDGVIEKIFRWQCEAHGLGWNKQKQQAVLQYVKHKTKL